jgi:drug/metabolite transporter (DMT)-like permease
MMSRTTRAWLQIHFCVVLWGFTAILGKLITLNALPLVWWRMVLVTAALACVPRVWRAAAALPPGVSTAFAGVGVLVAAHWITFYGAIKLANASVAATCMALGPVFLAVVEPWVARRPFDARELLVGLAVVPGVALVVGGIPDAMRLGLAMGILSAAIVAVFAAFNKRLVARADALTVTALEMGAGVVFLTALAPALPPASAMFIVPGVRDAVLLVTLASICTLLPFALSLVALRHLSAFGTTLAVNLEPVYAILLAIALLGEQHELSTQFYAGVAIILVVVFSYPFLRRGETERPS